MKIYQNQKAARRLTWNDDQLEKLAEYRDKLMGKEVPSYFDELKLTGKGLSETAFK